MPFYCFFLFSFLFLLPLSAEEELFWRLLQEDLRQTEELFRFATPTAKEKYRSLWKEALKRPELQLQEPAMALIEKLPEEFAFTFPLLFKRISQTPLSSFCKGFSPALLQSSEAFSLWIYSFFEQSSEVQTILLEYLQEETPFTSWDPQFSSIFRPWVQNLDIEKKICAFSLLSIFFEELEDTSTLFLFLQELFLSGDPDQITLCADLWINFPQKIKKYQEEFLKSLSHENPTIRAQSARLLGHLKLSDEKEIQRLAQAYFEEDPQVRFQVIQALSSLRSPQIFPVLEEALSDEEDAVVLSAVESLGKFQNPRALSLLIHSLEEESDDDIRLKVIEALGTFGKQAEAALPHLLLCLEDSNWKIQNACIEVLGKIGKREAIPLLLKKLSKSSIPLKIQTALIQIGQTEDSFSELYLKAFQEASTPLRLNFLYIFHGIGKKAEQTLPLLCAFYQASTDSLQWSILWTVRAINPQSPEIFPLLEHALSSGNWILQEEALNIVREQKAYPHSLSPLLFPLLSSTNTNTALRFKALLSLQHFRPVSPKLFSALFFSLQDPQWDIQNSLQYYLKNLQPQDLQEHQEFLLSVLEDTKASHLLHEEAQKCLEKIKSFESARDK
jgi:HEAT repeat protein